MNPKCASCNSCLEVRWLDNNVYYYCWLCQLFYRIFLGRRTHLEEVTEEENKILLDKMKGI